MSIFDKRWGSGNDYAKQEVMSWNVTFFSEPFPRAGKFPFSRTRWRNSKGVLASSNIQQFIRIVLNAVTNLQGQSSSNNEPGSSPQQYSRVEDEISARFRIPRGEGNSSQIEPPSDLGALVDFNPRQNYSIPRQVRSLRGMGTQQKIGEAGARPLVQLRAQLPRQSIFTKIYACFQVLTTTRCQEVQRKRRW